MDIPYSASLRSCGGFPDRNAQGERCRVVGDLAMPFQQLIFFDLTNLNGEF